MKLNFAKLSPTQNMTIIVNDPVSRKDQPRIAAQLMAYGSVGAEQVGFREEPALSGARARLQMMGGEFCGNAGMSMAALLALEDELPDGSEAVYPLEISGAAGLVSCRIQRKGESYFGTVEMPLPEGYGRISGYPAVFFDGIAHCIVPEEAMTAAEAEAFAAAQCAKQKADAFGVLLVNADMSAFRPLVYVRETGSAVWEHGCGSGCAAIGAYAAVQNGGDTELSLQQPGGMMQVKVRCINASICQIRITGEVRIAAIGTAWIAD